MRLDLLLSGVDVGVQAKDSIPMSNYIIGKCCSLFVVLCLLVLIVVPHACACRFRCDCRQRLHC